MEIRGSHHPLIDVMRGHPLFCTLDIEAAETLLRNSKVQHFKSKDIVVSKGGRATSMYLVISGRLKVQNVSEDGKTLITRILEVNDTFDEIALLDGKPRTASVISVTASELLAIEREAFMKLLRTHSVFAVGMIQSLCYMLRSTNDFLESMVFLNLPVRLAKILRLLAMKYGQQDIDFVEMNARISQSDLASLVGASRESINKQLRSWEDAGLISIQENGKLRIYNQIMRLAEDQ